MINSCLVNPPSGVVTHSYMPLIPLSVLNKYLSVHIFQNSCSKEYHWTHVTYNIIEVSKCHKINISCPFEHILFYVIHFLLAACAQLNCSHNPAIFPGILTPHFNCNYFSIHIYVRKLLECLLRILPSGWNPSKGHNNGPIENTTKSFYIMFSKHKDLLWITQSPLAV